MDRDNLSDLVADWGGFEQLVAHLNETGDVSVERNVKLKGKSGATRQIDVLIRHRQGLYEHLVVVECKYLNSPVERIHVDALATTVREVNASRGVIFSVHGFQAGAVTQAKQDGIDLFKVRQPTDAEWGLPGRKIDLFIRVVAISIGALEFVGAFAIPEFAPKSTSLNLRLDDNPTQTKMRFKGCDNETLEALIGRIARDASGKLLPRAQVKFQDGSYDGCIFIRSKVNIEPKDRPIQAYINDGHVFIPRITFDIGVKIDQSFLSLDRADGYAFILCLEDCVKSTVTRAIRRKDELKTSLMPVKVKPLEVNDEIVQNHSIISVEMKDLYSFAEFENVKEDTAMCVPKSNEIASKT